MEYNSLMDMDAKTCHEQTSRNRRAIILGKIQEAVIEGQFSVQLDFTLENEIKRELEVKGFCVDTVMNVTIISWGCIED